MYPSIEPSWKAVLKDEFQKKYFLELMQKVNKAYLSTDVHVFPPQELIFNAFEQCPFSEVKVVILGQDPYHKEGQAHGLAFSVPDGIKVPPSLRNIYKELYGSMNRTIPSSGNLEHWTHQGILLLNSVLTVEEGNAGAHAGWGWERFTDAIIQKISDEKEHVVFLLWGAYAQAKGKNIDTTKHLVLTSSHPSPLSAHRGFLGCNHFNKTNTYLKKYDVKNIDWYET